MLKILPKISIAAAPLLLLLFFAEVRLRTFKTIYEQKKIALESNIKDIDLLILGNSHGRDAIIPKFLTASAYNLSLPSQSLFYNEQIIEKYLPELKSLKTVIITIDYHSFYFIDQELSAFRNDKVFGVRRTGYNYRLTAENFSYFFFVYGALPSLAYLWKPPGDGTLEDGWQPQPTADSTLLSERSCVLRANDQNRLVNRNRNLKYRLSRSLDNMISLLGKNKIRVILLSTPVYPAYFNKLDKKVVQWNNDTISVIAGKYGLPYLNFMNNSSFSFADFSDADHLSKTGAMKFSRIIKEILPVSQ